MCKYPREGFSDHPRDRRCAMSSCSGCAGTGGELPCVGSVAFSIFPHALNHPLVSLCFNVSLSAGAKCICLFVSFKLQVRGSEERC